MVAALAALIFPDLAAADALVAEEITAPRLPALVVGGPDADAGLGDFALQNGTLCAAVAAIDHETSLSPRGGTLVDLGHCGERDDQWVTLHPLFNLSRERVLPLERIRAERDAHEARIVSEGEGEGVRARITHALDDRTPTELRVRTEITRLTGGPRVFAYAEAALHASGQMRSFHLYRRDLARSRGFSHPETDPDSVLALIDTIVEEDAHVLVGGEELPPISYGLDLHTASLVRADGTREPLPTFSITGEDFTMVGLFSRQFWLGGGDPPGMFELAQIPLMTLDEGETLVLERSIHVGERADVASVADQLLPGAVPVTGRVDDPSARLHFATADGAPVSQVRPNADGSFALRLPLGAYQVRALAPGRRRVVREIVVGEAGAKLAPFAMGGVAKLTLPRGETMRLVVLGLGETKTPHFDDDGLEFRVGDGKLRKGSADNVISLASAATDPREVVLAAGRYRVLATRGPEYDVHETEIELAAGETRALEIHAPEHAVDSAGWLGADLHVHSAYSMDSALPLARQLAAFAAHGGEVIVNTEHDRVVDARPEVARLGLADRIASVVGAEITGTYHGGETPFTIGHLNAFPLRADSSAYRGGAPRSEGRRLRTLYADLRVHGNPFVQINHPRESEPVSVGDGAYFTHLGVAGEPFEPALPLAAEPNRVLLEADAASGLRDLDFSGLEIANGKRLERYRLARADWLSLLLQGHRRTATANSDSHSVGEIPALPRTYVALADDRIATLDESALLAALRAGRSFGSTGPLLFATLGGKGPGETFAGGSGVLRVEVRAAPWVPVAELRVAVNAERVALREIARGGALELPLSFAKDSFVTVEVFGAVDEPYASLLPGYTPFAFTNAIYVDADGDGTWSAPGLPDPAPPLLADPLAD
jgi:hypothetical protein